MTADNRFGQTRPIPQGRVVDKLDEYMSRRDYAGAERHLLYWLAEARQGGDLRGELTVRNELIGHCRKTGQREKAQENIDAALFEKAKRTVFSEPQLDVCTETVVSDQSSVIHLTIATPEPIAPPRIPPATVPTTGTVLPIPPPMTAAKIVT